MASVITKIYVKSSLSYYWKFEGLIEKLNLKVKSVEKLGDYKTTNTIYNFIVEIELSDFYTDFVNSGNLEKYKNSEFKYSLTEFVKDLENYIRLQKKIQSIQSKGL